jgi:hypothetical protein
MSWPLVRVRVRVGVNFSLNIFLETITPRKLIFCRNVPWGVLFCSRGSEIPNVFRTGSEKLGKKAKSLKIFFSRTVSATGEQKPVL